MRCPTHHNAAPKGLNRSPGPPHTFRPVPLVLYGIAPQLLDEFQAVELVSGPCRRVHHNISSATLAHSGKPGPHNVL